MKNYVNRGYRAPTNHESKPSQIFYSGIAEGFDWVERLSISTFVQRVGEKEITTHSIFTLYRLLKRARRLSDSLTFFHPAFPTLSKLQNRIEREIKKLEALHVGELVG